MAQVIITSEHRTDFILQFLSRFQRAGYCHLLPVVITREQCKEVLHSLSLHADLFATSCGYYRAMSKPTPGQPEYAKMKFFKVKVIPRFTWWHK